MMAEEPLRVTHDQLKSVLKARRERSEIFGEGLFSDPAWDILLELFAAELANRKSSLADLSAIAPQSTLARWLVALQDRGLVECEADALQSGQFWVELSRDCSAKMRRFVSDAQILAPLT